MCLSVVMHFLDRSYRGPSFCSFTRVLRFVATRRGHSTEKRRETRRSTVHTSKHHLFRLQSLRHQARMSVRTFAAWSAMDLQRQDLVNMRLPHHVLHHFCIIFISFLYHVLHHFGSSWDHVRVIMGSSLGHPGDHFGVIMGSFWDHFGVILGIILGSF